MNQSNLDLGESLPISKMPITEDELKNFEPSVYVTSPSISKHLIYSGTKVIRAREGTQNWGNEEDLTIGVVVRTGFNTTKGTLIRSMLFPRPNKFKFYEDSFRFIMVLAGIGNFNNLD